MRRMREELARASDITSLRSPFLGRNTMSCCIYCTCFVAFTTSPLHLALLPATDQPHSGHHCVVHFIQIKLLLPKDIAPKLHMCRPLSSREDGYRCDGCNTRATTPSETTSSGRWQLLSPATACVCWTRPAPYKQDAPSTAAL